MDNKQKYILLIPAVAFLFLSANSSSAGIDACSVSVNPNQLNVNTSGTLSFSVANGSSETIGRWIKISAPTEQYEIISGSSNGWSKTIPSATEIIFKNGGLGVGESAAFLLNVQSNKASFGSFGVSMSDSLDGADARTCSGNTEVEIVGGVDELPPAFEAIRVSEITSSSVKIDWQTTEPATSFVEYGSTITYGTTRVAEILQQEHGVTLTGLTSDATYHYRIKGTDSSGNIGQTLDNTFTTAKEEVLPTPTPTPTPIVTSTPTSTPSSEPDEGDKEEESKSSSQRNDAVPPTPKPTKKPTPKPVPLPVLPLPSPVYVDSRPPVVTMDTDFSEPFSASPLISGGVNDENAIVVIDYSTDGGKNWLPVNTRSEAGKFFFLPDLYEEGNYQLIVRARDEYQNVGYSSKNELVIDRLPPVLGIPMINFGPQIIQPNKAGDFVAVTGLPQTVTFSASGGPTTIDLIAKNIEGDEQQFSLVKNISSGLWSGSFVFQKPGLYEVISHAIDGAKRESTRRVFSVLVDAPGVVVNDSGVPQANVKIKIFARDNTSKNFVLWNGDPFGIANPIKTEQNGQFALLLPAGTYYLQVEKFAFRNSRTPIFITDKTSALPIKINLGPSIKNPISFVNNLVANFLPKNVPLVYSSNFETKKMSAEKKEKINEVIGKKAEDVFFDETVVDFMNKQQEKKAYIVAYLSGWLPDITEKIENLEKLSREDNKPVLAVLSHQSEASVAVLAKKINADIDISADSVGNFPAQLQIVSSPTVFFVNSDGVIERVD